MSKTYLYIALLTIISLSTYGQIHFNGHYHAIPYYFNGDVVDNSGCDHINAGSISVSAYHPSATILGYEWTHLVAVNKNNLPMAVRHNQNLYNLATSVNAYTVGVTFRPILPPHQQFKQFKDFYVLNDVSWTNPVHVNILSSGGLSRASDLEGHAYSLNELNPTSGNVGFFEFQVENEVAGLGIIGFSSVANPTEPQYYLIFFNNVFALVKGSTVVFFDTYKTGDVFRMTKDGSVIYVTKNGVMYTDYTKKIHSVDGNFVIYGLVLADFKFPFVHASFKCPQPDAYYSLKTKLDGSYYILDQSYLKLKYEGEYNSGNLRYNIYDWQRNIVVNPNNAFHKGFGDNRQPLALYNLGLLQNTMYTLEVTNEKMEKFMLRFKYLGADEYKISGVGN